MDLTAIDRLAPPGPHSLRQRESFLKPSADSLGQDFQPLRLMPEPSSFIVFSAQAMRGVL